MSEPQEVMLPDGTVLSLCDLPPPETTRWVASRKALVVRAIDHGLLTAEGAKTRYALSDEEIGLWREALERHGEQALKVTALQNYRHL